ncbi:hypothetical protein ANCDUO_04491 [Ancylostoma duodenale]|uniref:Uncharacterized protein n=1 Tax=Ancylostoma duodenale TaxID=51022 RepID=A0A0C2GUU4_9BILA|nr:hypothetical protein ANCDUO_04491 [Ancylostoma duodenale]
MVGGSKFSVFGRPLLDSVTVEATVVEKTTTYPELRYDRNNHRHVKAIHCECYPQVRGDMAESAYAKAPVLQIWLGVDDELINHRAFWDSRA